MFRHMLSLGLLCNSAEFFQTQGESKKMDGSKLGQLVAEQLGAIEDDYGEEGEIRAVCSIVEVVGPGDRSEVRVRTNCQGPPHALSLLTAAQASVLGMAAGPAT
jgi:hypothetical protein